jgi:dolichyl-phosphate-mannose--protein O-mannosyl transferase
MANTPRAKWAIRVALVLALFGFVAATLPVTVFLQRFQLRAQNVEPIFWMCCAFVFFWIPYLGGAYCIYVNRNYEWWIPAVACSLLVISGCLLAVEWVEMLGFDMTVANEDPMVLGKLRDHFGHKILAAGFVAVCQLCYVCLVFEFSPLVTKLCFERKTPNPIKNSPSYQAHIDSERASDYVQHSPQPNDSPVPREPSHLLFIVLAFAFVQFLLLGLSTCR